MINKMKCIDTEAYMNTFLENSLVGDELCDFLNHILSCSKCYEELETRYLLMEVLGRLEEGETIDLRKELSERITYARRRLRWHSIASAFYRTIEIFAGILVAFYVGGFMAWII